MTSDASIFILLIFLLLLIQGISEITVIQLNATYEDVTSPAFLSKADIAYTRILECLALGRPHMVYNRSQYFFPLDAEYHYQELFNKTAHMRRADMHYYAGYEGPWIENHWIHTFQSLPLSAFGGLIPIFAQWIDIEIRSHPDYNRKRDELMAMIRPNVLYIALSQGDKGLGNLPLRAPNILVLSAGGYGHIPIPLVRGHISYYSVSSPFKYDMSFFGSNRNGNRQTMLQIVDQLAKQYNLSYTQGQGNQWHATLLETKYNLAPRGYGRSSFRFTEIIQSGRIPVFMHDYGLPWIPYLGTNISVEHFGFYAVLGYHNATIAKMIDDIANTTAEEFYRRLEYVKEVRDYYTYEGVLKEILDFMSDPFGPKGGHLRCTVLPSTEN